MKTEQLLAKLRNLNEKIWAEGTRLRVSAPKGVLTPDIRVELASREEQILSLLDAVETGGTLRRAVLQLFVKRELMDVETAQGMPSFGRLTDRANSPAAARSAQTLEVRRHDRLSLGPR